jgi:hypothetical protein
MDTKELIGERLFSHYSNLINNWIDNGFGSQDEAIDTVGVYIASARRLYESWTRMNDAALRYTTKFGLPPIKQTEWSYEMKTR